MENQEDIIKISTAQMLEEFKKDKKAALEKFKGKKVLITGDITKYFVKLGRDIALMDKKIKCVLEYVEGAKGFFNSVHEQMRYAVPGNKNVSVEGVFSKYSFGTIIIDHCSMHGDSSKPLAQDINAAKASLLKWTGVSNKFLAVCAIVEIAALCMCASEYADAALIVSILALVLSIIAIAIPFHAKNKLQKVASANSLSLGAQGIDVYNHAMNKSLFSSTIRLFKVRKIMYENYRISASAEDWKSVNPSPAVKSWWRRWVAVENPVSLLFDWDNIKEMLKNANDAVYLALMIIPIIVFAAPWFIIGIIAASCLDIQNDAVLACVVVAPYIFYLIAGEWLCNAAARKASEEIAANQIKQAKNRS